jgi:hypothetical protein
MLKNVLIFEAVLQNFIKTFLKFAGFKNLRIIYRRISLQAAVHPDHMLRAMTTNELYN